MDLCIREIVRRVWNMRMGAASYAKVQDELELGAGEGSCALLALLPYLRRPRRAIEL